MARSVDDIDTTLLRALVRTPDATNLALSEATGLARNTVRARLTRFAEDGTLRSLDRRIDPTSLGFPLQAFAMTRVTQRKLAAVSQRLADIPEVVQVYGLSGKVDLLVYLVARDADDMYRIAGQILGIDGVKRTTTHFAMGEFVEYRLTQLIGGASSRLSSTPRPGVEPRPASASTGVGARRRGERRST